MAAEKQFEKKVKNWLSSLKKEGYPIKFIKIWGGGFQKAGIPDLICCINSIYFEVELKSSVGKPSELQKYNIRLTNEANGIGIILYPEGFEQFKNIVKGVLNCNSHIQDLTALKVANSSTKCDTLIK
ncbi:MAG: VRR-NUC domain-containing protein [Bacilli bacterium]|nr:VRR-NUC domain-containing protein [Bacilli bacterium]